MYSFSRINFIDLLAGRDRRAEPFDGEHGGAQRGPLRLGVRPAARRRLLPPARRMQPHPGHLQGARLQALRRGGPRREDQELQ